MNFRKVTEMKRKFNVLIIITFTICYFTFLKAFDLEAETFTYTYDEVGNMVMKDSDDDDGDGLSNTEESGYGTNPQNPDTDGDGMPDGWEVTYSLDPLVNDSNGDPDGDGKTNLQEYLAGRNPIMLYDLILANETISTGTLNYQAENSITAGPAYIIESGANVILEAGNIISLIPGFTADGGSDFSATIE